MRTFTVNIGSRRVQHRIGGPVLGHVGNTQRNRRALKSTATFTTASCKTPICKRRSCTKWIQFRRVRQKQRTQNLKMRMTTTGMRSRAGAGGNGERGVKLTARRLEIMHAIARGEILFQPGWLGTHRTRWRDSGMRESRCLMFRHAGPHGCVTKRLAEKMEACGLIEKFKPHAGVPCYRLTVLGHEVLERASDGMGRFIGTQFG